MRTYIKVSSSLRRDIVDRFGIDRILLWRSLVGLSNSDTAKSVRDYALSHGGRWVTEVSFIPDCETRHFEGGFVQEFKNGIAVRSLGDKVSILQDGRSVAEFTGVTLNAWGNVLVIAQSLASGMTESKALEKMTEA